MLNKHGGRNLNTPHLQLFSLISTFFMGITTQLLPLAGMWKKPSSCLHSHQMPSKCFIARIYLGKLHTEDCLFPLTRRLTSFMGELNMEAMYPSIQCFLVGRRRACFLPFMAWRYWPPALFCQIIVHLQVFLPQTLLNVL